MKDIKTPKGTPHSQIAFIQSKSKLGEADTCKIKRAKKKDNILASRTLIRYC